MGVPAGRPGAQGVSLPVPRHGHLVVPVPLRPADRDPGRARADRAHARRSGPASDHLRADAGINRLEGVGVSEAPRGTLFHHYQVDEDGLIQRVNLIIATGQNNLAMNRTVAQIAGHYIKGPQIPEGVLNRLEAGIRAFDPCLSCSTHARWLRCRCTSSSSRPMGRSRTRSGGTERGAMPDSRTASILVIGYGNTLRRDDAVGCLIADEVACWQRPGVRSMSVAQLTPELAAELAAARRSSSWMPGNVPHPPS